MGDDLGIIAQISQKTKNPHMWQEFLTMRFFLEFFYTNKLYVKIIKI